MTGVVKMTQPPIGSDQLTTYQIQEILKQPNGRDLLLELVRMNRIDPETAITAIEKSTQLPTWKKILFALLETLFSK